MDAGLENKIVLITGGSKGIGLSCAEAFARAGAHVVIVSRDEVNLTAATQQLACQNFNVNTYAADLSDATQAASLITKIEEELGPIDVLVNSAGAAKRHAPATLTPQAWIDAMNAKYFTYINVMDAMLKRMVPRGHGAIVNIIGAGGKSPNPVHLPGGAANAALMLATAGLATAWASSGIRINGINPGPTETDRVTGSIQAEAELKASSPEQVLDAMKSRIPMGRFAKPEEIANVAVFLASGLSSYVTGAIITMDGAAHPSIV